MVAYEGNEPYVFISYAHKDKGNVLPIIQGLQDRGFRVWYDEGIEVGSEWPDFIAEHLENCACVLSFVSRNFGDSHNCRQEFTFSQNLHKDNSIVYLEDPKVLRAGLRMQLSNLHALYCEQSGAQEKLLKDLAAAKVLKPCLDVAAASGKIAGAQTKEQNHQGASVEKMREAANRKLAELAVKKYGRDKTSASALTKRSELSAEELYNQAKGLSKKQEYIKAYFLYKGAAEMGYAPAQNELGHCYQHGEGVTWDKVEAVKWYSKAADQGCAAAQYNLGMCYDNGWGVNVKKAEARKWYQKAADQGDKKALEKLKTL